MKSKLLFCLVLCFALISRLEAQNAADWKWRLPAKAGILNAVRNETQVFVADFEGNVAAFNKQTGRKIWEINSADSEKTYKLLLKQNTLLLIGGDKNEVRAIDVDTRKTLWIQPLKGDNFYHVKLAENALLNSEENLKAYNLTNGKLQWENKDCEGDCYAEVSGDGIFQVGKSGIFAVNKISGAINWTFKRRGNFNLIGGDAASIFFEFDNEVQKSIYSFDRKTGKTNWQFLVDDKDDFLYTIAENRLYAAPLNSPRIFAVNTADGKNVWDYKADENEVNGRFSRPTTYQNRVYSGGSDGYLYVFDKADGKLITRRKISDSELSAPLIVGNFGYVLERNIVHQINLATGKSLWKFSTFGGVEEIEYEAGILYFAGREFSYNALDLAKIERLSRLKRPLGTSSPDEKSLERAAFSIGGGSGTEPEKDEQVFSEPAFADGKMYFTVTNQAAGQGVLYETNLSDGKKRIVAQIKSVNLTVPTVHAGIAYLYDLPINKYGRESSNLIAVEVVGGRTKWTKTAPAVFDGKPEIIGNAIYAARIDRTASRFDLQGNLLNELRTEVSSSPEKFIFGDERKIFFQPASQTFAALDLDSGKPVWIFEKPQEWITAFAETSDSAVLLAVSHEAIYKIKRQTGETIWKKEFPDDAFVSLKPSNGKIFALSRSFTAGYSWLLAIDLADGKVLWEKDLGKYISQSVFSENNICLNGEKGLECFNQNDGQPARSFLTENIFFGATETGIAVYLIRDEKTKRTTKIRAVNIKTGQEIWQTNL